jgi:hypothetical protein
MNRKAQRFRRRYESVEYFCGVAVPLICAFSILDYFGLIRWAWLFLLWLSCGHYSIYFYDLYPLRLKYRPFGKGLFVFGVGVLWPVWCTVQMRKRRLSG